MLVRINVNCNNLSRKYKYVTGVLKLFTVCDPVIAFLEILINVPKCSWIFMPNDVHCNVIYIPKKKVEKIYMFTSNGMARMSYNITTQGSHLSDMAVHLCIRQIFF